MNVFTVSVTVELINKLSSQMSSVNASLRGAGKDVDHVHSKLQAFHSRLNAIRSFGSIGGELFREAAGFLGEIMEPAKEYHQQISLMNQAGLSHIEILKNIEKAKSAAFETKTGYIENLRTLNDFRVVLGSSGKSLDEARELLKPFAQAQRIAQGASEDPNVGSQSAFAALKVAEMRGNYRTPAQITNELTEQMRALVATGGRVRPEDYLMVTKYLRQAKMTVNDEFMYKVLPELIMENKTGKGGGASTVGMQVQAAYRQLVQGTMSRATAANLQAMGLLTGATLNTSTVGTQTIKGGHVIGDQLFSSSPAAWVEQYLMPKLLDTPELKRGYAAGDKSALQAVSLKVSQIFKGAGLATAFMQEIVAKMPQFEKFGYTADHLKGGGTLDSMSKNVTETSPNAALKGLQSAWENLRVAMGEQVIPVLIPAVNQLADTLNRAAKYIHGHPEIGKTISGAVVGIGKLGETIRLFAQSNVGFAKAIVIAMSQFTASAWHLKELKAAAENTGSAIKMMGGWLFGFSNMVIDVSNRLFHTSIPKVEDWYGALNQNMNKWANAEAGKMGFGGAFSAIDKALGAQSTSKSVGIDEAKKAGSTAPLVRSPLMISQPAPRITINQTNHVHTNDPQKMHQVLMQKTAQALSDMVMTSARAGGTNLTPAITGGR